MERLHQTNGLEEASWNVYDIGAMKRPKYHAQLIPDQIIDQFKNDNPDLRVREYIDELEDEFLNP